MKRIILTSLCAIVALGLFAQKALVIHKKDGTKVEIPMRAVQGFAFGGKAIVNDDDYVQLTDVQLHSGVALDMTFGINLHTDDPHLCAVENPQYGEDWGVLYATTPEVTIENGELVVLDEKQVQRPSSLGKGFIARIHFGESEVLDGLKNPNPTDLDFETTYYLRAFVRRPASDGREAAYLYSKAQRVYTDKPTMRYYGVKVAPALYAQTGYVMVSTAAWTAFMAQYPHFAGGESAMDVFSEVWSEYLTEQRIEQLKPQCTTVYECCDGTIYVLDAVGEDFAQHLLTYCDQPIIMSGYVDEEHYFTSNQIRVECSEELNVPNNEYWAYIIRTPTGNPTVKFELDRPLLAGYKYKLEITFAPDTTVTDPLPNKYNVTLVSKSSEGQDKKYSVAKNQQTKVLECTTVTFTDIPSEGFGNASLELAGKVGAREKGFDRILRIAQVKVTPLSPGEE